MINHLKTKNHEDALKLFESENAEMTPKLTSVWAQKNAEEDLQNKLDEQLVRIMVRQKYGTTREICKNLVAYWALIVPATSVSSERTFSMAGLLYANTLRNRLSAKMAENLMLIKASLKMLSQMMMN
uniref:HAT C-terminal dimerisation domain-containing protein n=1 Tax=Globodera rostochiensis TaxID=31243 RepID=A0A914I6Z8_GLORO